MSNQSGARTEAVFDALGEPTRRRIVEVLSHGPAPVAELAGKLPVGRPAVSRHLRTLSDAGLVRHVARGTKHLYSLAPEGLVAARDWLVQTWDIVLGAYAAEVARADATSKTEEADDTTVSSGLFDVDVRAWRVMMHPKER
ncbi:MAG TPA: metalloregulator ArsR/SmtB family transcription factor [Acidimicrobiales bacterium]|nr:metalloregulator ArsR/SmtB family transcription factor [Acidimicrobiales bacterium]